MAGGTKTMETINEYAIVIAAVMPNCWDARSGEALAGGIERVAMKRANQPAIANSAAGIRP